MRTDEPVTLELRPVTDADEATLLQVYRSVRAAEFEQFQGTDAAVQTLLDLQFGLQRAQYSARHPLAEHSLLTVAGALVGAILVDARTDALHLVDLSVLAEHQGQGVGSAALAGLCGRADAAGIPIDLQVWSRNESAIRLYGRFGFVTVAEPGEAGPPGETPADGASIGYRRMQRPAGLPAEPAPPTHSDFAGRVGHPFTALTDGVSSRFVLTHCGAPAAGGGYSSFALTFRSEPGHTPAQGIYSFTAPGFGPADIFIVPVGQTALGTDYHVAFSHREG